MFNLVKFVYFPLQMLTEFMVMQDYYCIAMYLGNDPNQANDHA